jgi:hypothetical protein
MKILLAYLLIGSFFVLWNTRNETLFSKYFRNPKLRRHR